MGRLDSHRHAGGDGVGHVEIILREGRLHRPAVEMKDPQTLSGRAKEGADNRSHRPLLHTAGRLQIGIGLDVPAEHRFALIEAALGQRLAEGFPLLEMWLGGNRPRLQLARLFIAQHNRAALSVQHRYRVVQDRLQHLVNGGDIAKVIAGSQQGQKMLAVLESLFGFAAQAFQSFFPGALRSGLDADGKVAGSLDVSRRPLPG